jgi:hypothetical protein
MAFNFADKSLWNVALANGGLNNINVSNLGVVNTDTRLPTTSYGSLDDLGKRIWVEAPNIGLVTNTTNGTLFGGYYQLVTVDSGANAADVVVGKVAFVKNTAAGNTAFTVTSEGVATGASNEVAGIFLNTITPGNIGAICIGGKVNIKLKNPITNGGAAEGDALFAGGGSGTVDDLTLASVFSTLFLNKYLGYALAVPVSNTTIAMEIKGILGVY